MDERTMRNEAGALLALMARRGVAVLKSDGSAYRLGVFSTGGMCDEALPGLLGKLGLRALDLPKPPAPETVIVLLRAGLIAPAFAEAERALGVYILTAEGLRQGWAMARAALASEAVR